MSRIFGGFYRERINKSAPLSTTKGDANMRDP